MVQKFLIFSALVAVSSAVLLPGPAYHGAIPVAKYALPAVAKVAVPEPYDPNPQYSFSYDVHDATTGDVKSQQETRNGDAVQGAYSLIEPDGSRRIVEYTADPVHGFNAVVRREPGAVKVAAVAKVISPIAKVLAPAPLYHAPVLSKALLPASPLGLLGHAHLGLPSYH